MAMCPYFHDNTAYEIYEWPSFEKFKEILDDCVLLGKENTKVRDAAINSADDDTTAYQAAYKEVERARSARGYSSKTIKIDGSKFGLA
jgi:hypothetical protein